MVDEVTIYVGCFDGRYGISAPVNVSEGLTYLERMNRGEVCPFTSGKSFIELLKAVRIMDESTTDRNYTLLMTADAANQMGRERCGILGTLVAQLNARSELYRSALGLERKVE